MKPSSVAVGLLLSLAASSVCAVAAANPGVAKAPSDAIRVTLDQTRVETTVGTRLTMRSHIANTSAAATDPLVAHLNVASLDGVYTDLEDWTADVTRAVTPLAPGSGTSLTWQFQAVNTGSFDVYVAVMPNGTASAGKGPLAVSPPLHVTVAGRPTLTAGGALPVVLVIPVLLGATGAAAWLHRRRRERGERPGFAADQAGP